MSRENGARRSGTLDEKMSKENISVFTKILLCGEITKFRYGATVIRYMWERSSPLKSLGIFKMTWGGSPILPARNILYYVWDCPRTQLFKLFTSWWMNLMSTGKLWLWGEFWLRLLLPCSLSPVQFATISRLCLWGKDIITNVETIWTEISNSSTRCGCGDCWKSYCLSLRKRKKPFLTHDYEASVRILSLLLLFVVGPCTKWM